MSKLTFLEKRQVLIFSMLQLMLGALWGQELVPGTTITYTEETKVSYEFTETTDIQAIEQVELAGLDPMYRKVQKIISLSQSEELTGETIIIEDEGFTPEWMELPEKYAFDTDSVYVFMPDGSIRSAQPLPEEWPGGGGPMGGHDHINGMKFPVIGAHEISVMEREGYTVTIDINNVLTAINGDHTFIYDPVKWKTVSIRDERRSGGNKFIAASFYKQVGGMPGPILAEEYMISENTFYNSGQPYRMQTKKTYSNYGELGGGLFKRKAEKKDFAATIYPHPASDRLYVQIEGAKLPDTYRLIDLNGIVIIQASIPATGALYTSLDISAIPAGMYMIELIDDGNTLHTEKIIKQ